MGTVPSGEGSEATARSAFDDLAKPRQHSDGLVIPKQWGRQLKLEEDGGVFAGRYCGSDQSDRFKSGAYLFWGGDELCFLFSSVQLDREFEREQPSIGDDVVIYRGQNYGTTHDKDAGRAPTGLTYGMATRANAAPTPAAPLGEDEYRF